MKDKPCNPDACCGADCYAFGSDANEPCYGDVAVYDEVIHPEDGGYYWVHSCEGHWGCFGGAKYKEQEK